MGGSQRSRPRHRSQRPASQLHPPLPWQRLPPQSPSAGSGAGLGRVEVPEIQAPSSLLAREGRPGQECDSTAPQRAQTYGPRPWLAEGGWTPQTPMAPTTQTRAPWGAAAEGPGGRQGTSSGGRSHAPRQIARPPRVDF